MPKTRPNIVVKFRDRIAIPYADGAEQYIRQHQLGPIKKLSERFPGVRFDRAFTALAPQQFRELAEKGKVRDRSYSPPNFLGYFRVTAAPDADLQAMVAELRTWPAVERAYRAPRGSSPIGGSPAYAAAAAQGHLQPAPQGIGATTVWPQAGVGFAGADGSGQRLIDVELGWTLNHRDLVSRGASLLDGTIQDSERPHGTAVLGLVCGDGSTCGVGVAPCAKVDVVSWFNDSVSNALSAAVGYLSSGDVLLIEAQVFAPTDDLAPVEIDQLSFDVIRLATANGIVVVEAAGNGPRDLDTVPDDRGFWVLNRTVGASVGYRDSGAILVGAANSALPHPRWGLSNFGSRIDCYAPGDSVVSCSSTSTGDTTVCTGSFAGTSAASAIIAGAALSVQGMWQAYSTGRFDATTMRGVLTDPAASTPSANPPSDRIGVMPDLERIVNCPRFRGSPEVT